MSENELKKDGLEKNRISDFTETNSGEKVYDKGESVVSKMNREKGVFDRDLFFQELFENYLVCVQRNEVREKPASKLILHWNMSTSFDDFLTDSIENIDRQISSIKFGKAVNAQKMHNIGTDILGEAKIDSGSSEVGRQFSVEDYDAVHEILRKSKEAIVEYKTGKIEMLCDSNTGRVRITKAH